MQWVVYNRQLDSIFAASTFLLPSEVKHIEKHPGPWNGCSNPEVHGNNCTTWFCNLSSWDYFPPFLAQEASLGVLAALLSDEAIPHLVSMKSRCVLPQAVLQSVLKQQLDSTEESGKPHSVLNLRATRSAHSQSSPGLEGTWNYIQPMLSVILRSPINPGSGNR